MDWETELGELKRRLQTLLTLRNPVPLLRTLRNPVPLLRTLQKPVPLLRTLSLSYFSPPLLMRILSSKLFSLIAFMIIEPNKCLSCRRALLSIVIEVYCRRRCTTENGSEVCGFIFILVANHHLFCRLLILLYVTCFVSVH